MTNDSIADMLIRIQNGYMARKSVVEVPYSRIKLTLLTRLQKYGYIGEVNNNDGNISVSLIYRDGAPALSGVKRISKPGLRRYIKHKDLGKYRFGLGHVILSTPKGLKDQNEASKEQIGGELLCAVW